MALVVAAQQPPGTATLHVADDTLSAYVDGELPTEEWLAVEDHLRDCGYCEAVVQAHRRIGAQVRSLAVKPVPPALFQGLRSRLPWH